MGKPSSFDFTACSGDVLDDIDGQVAKLAGRRVDLVTLAMGGNDFGFANITVMSSFRHSGTKH
jgi:hypothetical protein